MNAVLYDNVQKVAHFKSNLRVHKSDLYSRKRKDSKHKCPPSRVMTARKQCPLSKVTFGTLTVCDDCIPTHCNTLQHTATHCNTMQHNATHCNTLQHTATQCNTMQHNATQCNTIQHNATQCNTTQHSVCKEPSLSIIRQTGTPWAISTVDLLTFSLVCDKRKSADEIHST